MEVSLLNMFLNRSLSNGPTSCDQNLLQDFVEVDAGDRILLYTGAHDGTPDGPGSVGQLIWTLQRD